MVIKSGTRVLVNGELGYVTEDADTEKTMWVSCCLDSAWRNRVDQYLVSRVQPVRFGLEPESK